MRLLLDTHVLLWVKGEPERLSDSARGTILDPATELVFSVVSLWEIVIKSGRPRSGLSVDAGNLRAELLEDGYSELDVQAAHVLEVGTLPKLHRDPFDRLLVAQARVEGLTLMTADHALTAYPVASMPA
ncbi:MAG: type II toxin-antitoxin system VapC family toxin [Actinobacteria bacterium]|nr:type II toxin-antitoxin system VapC family toxin [Actinomycetota bacterium]